MRKEGYYWIRFEKEWHIARYDHQSGGIWWMAGYTFPFRDNNFQKIIETPITKPTE
jgi:hypothetical protein